MLHHIATTSVCYGGQFESKMTAKIQKSSDLGEIWFRSRTKSTILSDDLFLCQVSKGSAVWSEFNIFLTLVTMATVAIFNMFNL
jgi:hypothetical protein